MERQLVVFSLQNELYGINIFDVQEIIKDLKVTKMPKTPVFVEGVINLRGKIIPVIDLRKRFELHVPADTKEKRAVIVNIGQQVVGLVVDQVKEVAKVKEDDIEQAPEITTVHAAFIDGVVKKDERLVIIINLNRILTLDEQEALKDVAKGEMVNAS